VRGDFSNGARSISEKRLSLPPQGKVRYPLKTPWKNGTAHVEFEPVELMPHIPVRHDAGDLRLSKSSFLPTFHRQTRGAAPATARAFNPVSRGLCAELEVARAADAIGASKTCSHRRGID